MEEEEGEREEEEGGLADEMDKIVAAPFSFLEISAYADYARHQ